MKNLYNFRERVTCGVGHPVTKTPIPMRPQATRSKNSRYGFPLEKTVTVLLKIITVIIHGAFTTFCFRTISLQLIAISTDFIVGVYWVDQQTRIPILKC